MGLSGLGRNTEKSNEKRNCAIIIGLLRQGPKQIRIMRKTLLEHLLKKLHFYNEEAKCTFDIYLSILYFQKTSRVTSKASFLVSLFMSLFAILLKYFKTLSSPTSFFQRSRAQPQYILHLMALSPLFRFFRNCTHSSRLSTN